MKLQQFTSESFTNLHNGKVLVKELLWDNRAKAKVWSIQRIECNVTSLLKGLFPISSWMVAVSCSEKWEEKLLFIMFQKPQKLPTLSQQKQGKCSSSRQAQLSFSFCKTYMYLFATRDIVKKAICCSYHLWIAESSTRPYQFNFMLLGPDQPKFWQMSFNNDSLRRLVLALVREGLNHFRIRYHTADELVHR